MQKHFLDEIKKEFPNLKWTKVEEVKRGMDHHVFLLDNKIIFRFPKEEWYGKAFKNEIALMKLLDTKLTTNVPVYKYISKNQRFGGYELVPGKDLERNKLTLQKNLISIAKGTAQFLNELHAIKLSELKKLKLGNRVVLKEYKRFHRDVEKYLFHKLDPKQKMIVQDFFDRLKKVLKQRTPKVLVHGDLSFDHILLKPDLKSVVGIIDFSDRSLSDTARDFTFFWHDKKFVNEVFKHYKFKDDTLLERSKIYFQGSALWEAVSAIRHNRPFAKFITMFKNRLDSTR